jgi:type II secretory pathway pseudopilin PulG
MRKSSTAGFTLIELVIALGLATTVLALAGSGIMVISQRDQAAAAARTNRYELQRTTSFMGNEVRMAAQIDPCPQIVKDLYSPASGSKNHYPVLSLQMPAASGLMQPIVYYVAEPPQNTVWSGPLVIYRWGPSMKLDGSYSQVVANTYFNEVVIDRIDKAVNIAPCPDLFSQSTSSTPQGFAACVEPNGSSVKLSIVRQGDKQLVWNSVISRRSQRLAVTPNICPAI